MIFHRLGLLNKNQMGFTLIEMIIVLAIAGVVTGATTMTIFQVISGSASTSNHMTAVRQVQEAGYRVSHDTQMAQEEPIIGDDPATELLTLTWIDYSGGAHQVTYTLEGTELWRDYDGQPMRVAEYINPDPTKTSCVWDGDVLTFTVTATVGGFPQEQSETRVYEVVPRPGS